MATYLNVHKGARKLVCLKSAILKLEVTFEHSLVAMHFACSSLSSTGWLDADTGHAEDVDIAHLLHSGRLCSKPTVRSELLPGPRISNSLQS